MMKLSALEIEIIENNIYGYIWVCVPVGTHKYECCAKIHADPWLTS